MTTGEIWRAGEESVEKYADNISRELLDGLIGLRKKDIRRRLTDDGYRDSWDRMKRTLDVLEKAESMPFYDNILKQTKERLLKDMRQVAESANISLTNAEYFGFSGRLR